MVVHSLHNSTLKRVVKGLLWVYVNLKLKIMELIMLLRMFLVVSNIVVFMSVDMH